LGAFLFAQFQKNTQIICCFLLFAYIRRCFGVVFTQAETIIKQLKTVIMNQHDQQALDSANAETYQQVQKITSASSFQERLGPTARAAKSTRYLFHALDGVIVAVGIFVMMMATTGNVAGSATAALLIAAGLELLVAGFLPLAVRHVVQGWVRSWRYVPSFFFMLILAGGGIYGCYYFSVKAVPEIVDFVRGGMQPPTTTPDSVATAFYDGEIAFKRAQIESIEHLADGSDWVVTTKTSPTLSKELTILVHKRDSVLSDNRARNERAWQNHKEGSTVVSGSVGVMGIVFLLGAILLTLFWEYYARESVKENPGWLERIMGIKQPPIVPIIEPQQPPIIETNEETRQTEPIEPIVPHETQPETKTETETEKQLATKHHIANLKKYLRQYYQRSIKSAAAATREENRLKAEKFREELEANGVAVMLHADGTAEFK
jgi:hypothetical protein